MYDGLDSRISGFSSQGIMILVIGDGFCQEKYVLIALIVSSDLVASVSRYPWQDHGMSWRQRGGGMGHR